MDFNERLMRRHPKIKHKSEIQIKSDIDIYEGFQTTHNLAFEACVWPRNKSIMLFRVGTCEGQWLCGQWAYCIISVINNSPHNGHLEDVFEWFEHSAKRDKRALMVLELFNHNFKKHLIDKRGFSAGRNDDVIKEWKDL